MIVQIVYIYIYIYIYFDLYLLFIVLGYAYEINVLVPCYDGNVQMYDSIFNEFNVYAEEKKLDFTLNIDYVKYDKPVESYVKFKSIVEELLKKNKNDNRHDLYFYDNDCKAAYSPYLMDLNDILTLDHINIYNQKIIKDTCIYNNRLIGLVRLTFIKFK